MSLETISNRILEEAQGQSEKNELDANMSAKDIAALAKKEGVVFIEVTLDNGQKKLRRLKKQRLAAANLAARDQVIKCKQEMIDKSFVRAREMMDDLKGDEYVGLLAKMMADKAHGGEDVILGSEEKKAGQEIIKRANNILAENGAKAVKLASDSKDFGKGFILRRGKIEENYVFSRLIEAAREELETDVAVIIFGEQK